MTTDLTARLRAAGCVFAEQEAALLRAGASTPAALEDMVRSRVDGVPLEHVLGWVEFAGLRVDVDPGVFVPRRRTELLVREATRLARGVRGSTVVVDLCCGSGALGVAVTAGLGGALGSTLGSTLGDVDLYAVDVDPAAVRCARRNVAACGGRVYEGDLFEPLPAAVHGRVDLVLANVPYVPSAEIALMPPEARRYEARVALDGGDDGLDVLRRAAAEARGWLVAGGHLLVETSPRQAPQAADVLARGGLTPRVTSDDVGGTVVVGTRDERQWPR